MYGASEPLEGKPVEAKNPFDPPDAPEKPDITGYSPSTCSLEWKPPANNGGRPITGYVIEKRERGGEWIRVSKLGFVSVYIICFFDYKSLLDIYWPGYSNDIVHQKPTIWPVKVHNFFPLSLPRWTTTQRPTRSTQCRVWVRAADTSSVLWPWMRQDLASQASHPTQLWQRSRNVSIWERKNNR